MRKGKCHISLIFHECAFFGLCEYQLYLGFRKSKFWQRETDRLLSGGSASELCLVFQSERILCERQLPHIVPVYPIILFGGKACFFFLSFTFEIS